MSPPGPLLRNDTFSNNGLNGIYIRAEVANSGIAEATNAVQYPEQPQHRRWGCQLRPRIDPYPYLLTSQAGDRFPGPGSCMSRCVLSDQHQRPALCRSPACSSSSRHGSCSPDPSVRSSLNVGDQTPTSVDVRLEQGTASARSGRRRPDLRPGRMPAEPRSPASPEPELQVSNSVGPGEGDLHLAQRRRTATTSYFDPISQAVTTTIVQALADCSGRVGHLAADREHDRPERRSRRRPLGCRPDRLPELATRSSTRPIFRFGGGCHQHQRPGPARNTPVLSIGGIRQRWRARVSITNDEFNDNTDVPINTWTPTPLLADRPDQRPLQSGDPFIHGNVFLNNGLQRRGRDQRHDRAQRGPAQPGLVNSVWTGTRLHLHPPRHDRARALVAAGGIFRSCRPTPRASFCPRSRRRPSP